MISKKFFLEYLNSEVMIGFVTFHLNIRLSVDMAQKQRLGRLFALERDNIYIYSLQKKYSFNTNSFLKKFLGIKVQYTQQNKKKMLQFRLALFT